MTEPLKVPRRDAPRPRIPGYEVGEVLGRGAAGVVYRARQLAIDRDVALKVLHAELTSRPHVVRRLQREARTTARLAHPHVVSAIDMGETDGRWWYAMELVDGPSLALRLRQEGRLKVREALRLFIPLCEALEHLWEHGVVHRDIKPANILIDRASGARLADLGLAFADDDPSLTGQGGTLGTPHYISPEQAVDPTAADVRSDIWSFGATMFHAVCGRPPFAGESAAEVLSGVLYARIPDPRELEPSLPKGLVLVLRKCLTRDPEGRYRSPHELLLDLERVRERRQPHVRRSALDPLAGGRGARRGWSVALAVVVLAAVVALFVFDPLGAGRRASGIEAASVESAFEPLEALRARARARPELSAQHRRELEELRVGLPAVHLERWEEIDRELSAELRERVLELRRETGRAVERELGNLDFASAGRLFADELPRLLMERTGYRLEELEGAGASLSPWLASLDARIQRESRAAAQRLQSDLAAWLERTLAEVDHHLERQDWNAALALLVEGTDAILDAAGRADVRLPEELLDDAVESVQTELRQKRFDVSRAWGELDSELARQVRRSRELLEEELEDGPPRPRAADDLAAQFARELDRHRLTRENMPEDLPRTCVFVLERALGELARREQELLEADARFDYEDASRLCLEYWAERRYEEIAELWDEVRERMRALESRTDAPWRAELERAAGLRREEARILRELLVRAGTRIRDLNGRSVDLRVGSITYSDVRVLAGPDPLRDGFRLEGLPELGTLDLRALPAGQIEELALRPDPDLPDRDLGPSDRLTLALFLFHEGRPADARTVLNSGPLPTDGVLAEIEGDLSGRVLEAVQEARAERRQREQEAGRHLELVFDAENQSRAPSNVLARIDLLLGEYADLPAVRRRLLELRSLRSGLRQARRPSDEEQLQRDFGPTRLEYPHVGRVRLGFDFGSASVGAWQRGDWSFDGSGWAGRAVDGWGGLGEQRGPRLFLRPPLDVDSFVLEVGFEPVHEEPAGLLLVSAAGFHVALVGPGLPGSDGRPRHLVGTGSLEAFLARLRDGEGEAVPRLVRPGAKHVLVLRGQRRAGRLRVELDGRLLEAALVPPAEDDDPRIEIRSWEPVRLTRLSLEASR